MGNSFIKLLSIALVLSNLALAQWANPNNHLGGVVGPGGGYIPGSGTAAPPLGAPLFPPPRPVGVPPARPPVLPAGATELHTTYTRGNDDIGERDQAGVSNYETALIRVSGYTRPRPGGGMTFGIRYVATLQTDEEQSPELGAQHWMLCGNTNLNNGLRPSPMRLALQMGPGGSPRGATLTAQLELGDITAQNGNFSGTCTIVHPGFGARQTISWACRVENGTVTSLTTTMVEANAGPGRRGGAEILRAYQSNQTPAPQLFARFPTRVGRATGQAIVGPGN